MRIHKAGFKKCEPFTLSRVLGKEKTAKALIVKQGDKYFHLDPMSRGEGYVSLRHFNNHSLSVKFPLKNRKIKFKSGVQYSKDLMCKGTAWTGMTYDEFLFAKGSYPSKVNRSTRSGMVHKQVVYTGYPLSKSKYYYFYNDILRSWRD